MNGVSVSTIDGLTWEEGEVIDRLFEAVEAYNRLPVQHPDEPREFADAIHAAQNQMAVRIARRHYSEGWPVVEADNEEMWELALDALGVDKEAFTAKVAEMVRMHSSPFSTPEVEPYG
jgi:biotin synthase-related radical SAM superfamily protein